MKHKEKRIKCDLCGKFIAYKDFDKRENEIAATVDFIPDTEVTTEEIAYRCIKCTKEHGPAEIIQI